MLDSGRFAHVPHLYGTNSDEGTDNAPVGTINTDEDLRNYLLHDTGFGLTDTAVSRIMELYPDDPALGIPLNTGGERFADRGWQYKRVAAIAGDVFYHAPRRYDAQRYAKHAPTYVYRFNTRGFVSSNSNSTTSTTSTTNPTAPTTCDGDGMLAPAYKGVAHFTEVAFVFGNPKYVGPWPGYRSRKRIQHLSLLSLTVGFAS